MCVRSSPLTAYRLETTVIYRNCVAEQTAENVNFV